MSYATPNNLLLWFGARELTEISVPDDRAPITAELLRLSVEGGVRDAFSDEAVETADQALVRIQAVLEEASRLLDSYLAHRYPLPLEGAVISASPLPRACSVLDLALLYDDRLPEAVDQRQKRVLAWLQALAAGQVELAPASVSRGRIAGGPSYAAGARVFDENTLRGFV